jgi:hypothetical protein
MLYNVEKELPAYVSAKLLTFSESAATELTIQDFQRICVEIKDQALIYKASRYHSCSSQDLIRHLLNTSAKNTSKDKNNLSNQHFIRHNARALTITNTLINGGNMGTKLHQLAPAHFVMKRAVCHVHAYISTQINSLNNGN